MSRQTVNEQAPAVVEESPEHDLSLALKALSDPQDHVVASDVPQEVREFVEREYETWKHNPIWRSVTFPTQKAAEAITAFARTYAREREPNLTFQVKTGFPKDGLLVFRARDKMRRKAGDSAS